MNEPAVRLEEQIISLFPTLETIICRHVLKIMVIRNLKAILRKETGENITEKIVTNNGSVVRIKRQELLYLPKRRLPYGVDIDDIFQFASGNHISRILVNIPEMKSY